MNEITVTLPIETLDACLAALAKLPYEFANPHITLIRQRGTEALNSQQKAEPEVVGGTD